MSKDKRSVGRPRTRPADAVNLTVPASRKELAAINAAAEKAGTSAAQWMRRELLKAAGIKEAK